MKKIKEKVKKKIQEFKDKVNKIEPDEILKLWSYMLEAKIICNILQKAFTVITGVEVL